MIKVQLTEQRILHNRRKMGVADLLYMHLSAKGWYTGNFA